MKESTKDAWRTFWKYHFFKVILGLIVVELVVMTYLQNRNHRPVAVLDEAEVFSEHSVKISVLQNDTDKDEQDLEIKNVFDPCHGRVIQQNKQIVYTPDLTYTGLDSFQYTISDGKKESKKAYVRVKVEPNLKPVAKPDDVMIFPWTETTIPVLQNDSDREQDSIYIHLVSKSFHGEIAQNGQEIIYLLKNKSAKQDSFTYSISDGKRISDEAWVRISVKQMTIIKFSPISEFGEMKNYDFLNLSRWDILQDQGNWRLCINTTRYQGGSGNSLGEYCLFRNRTYSGDFTLSFKVRSLEDLSMNQFADYAIVFAYQNAKDYCYAFLSSHPGQDGATGLYKIVDGRRQTVKAEGQAFRDNQYHQVELRRIGTEIQLKVDNKLILSASDDAFRRSGRVGVGSLNDQAYFDDIRVKGD